MLVSWPRMRVVETAAEAAPRCFRDTELIMAFTLGDEKRLNPRPVTTSATTILMVSESLLSIASNSSPIAVMLIPADARTRGSVWSDNLPISGEKMAIVSG
tara:strand:- start:5 stop:307 length:303 start_codon:yes stop_codon:yes gene_type:complete